MRAVTPDSGSVIFDNGQGPIDVLAAKGDALKTLRTKIQMVFQDPVSSLSPRMTVQNILSEPLEIHAPRQRPQPAGAGQGPDAGDRPRRALSASAIRTAFPAASASASASRARWRSAPSC